MVPDDYVRKQTLTNAERYSMPRLKELEDMILNAEDKLTGLEYDKFCSVREQIAAQIESVSGFLCPTTHTFFDSVLI